MTTDSDSHPAAPQAAAAPAAPQPRVRVETTLGWFIILLFDDVAPTVVANILDLMEAKFYDGQHIHRVVPNFAVQMGCPFTAVSAFHPSAGRGGPRGHSRFTLPLPPLPVIPDETEGETAARRGSIEEAAPRRPTVVVRDVGGNIPVDAASIDKAGRSVVSNTAMTVAMARPPDDVDPDDPHGVRVACGSQFFVNLVDNCFLDEPRSSHGDHLPADGAKAMPVIGHVVDGQDVLRTIEGVETDEAEAPLVPIKILSMVLVPPVEDE
jgi:cyclophilin family peptidyl-prolyl cis-trans isomerase